MKKNHLLWTIAVIAFAAILAACAPRQADVENPDSDDANDGNGQVIELPAWSLDSDCESCHAAEVASGSDSQCAYSQHTEVSCTTCHEDTDNKLTKGHEKYAAAAQPAKLKYTKVTSAPCTTAGCHSDAEGRIAATAQVTALTDSDGTTINPHALPTNKRHLSNVTCSSCHKMHKEDSPLETAPTVCRGCHHQDVYQCGTCHEYE
jgi:hypothetical protein